MGIPKNTNLATFCPRKEGLQAQGTRCPPQVLRDDRCCHHLPQGPHWILPPGHPQVHLCQLQGWCCQGCRAGPFGTQAWSCQGSSQDGQSFRKGSWIFKVVKAEKPKKVKKAKEPKAKKPKKVKKAKKPAAKKAKKPKKAAKKPAAKKAAKKPAAKKAAPKKK